MVFEPVIEEVNFHGWENVWVLREDLVHPYFGGNKWRKLKYNLEDIRNSGKKYLLTLGGTFSNHLVATAVAARENGIQSIGIVRGEAIENPYLNFMKQQGMHLHFISRDEYGKRNEEDFNADILKKLHSREVIDSPRNVFMIPEGGANDAGVKGASEISTSIPADTDIVVCACGTGTTMIGISKNLLPHQKILGIAVLKAEDYFEDQIKKFRGNREKITLNHDYHFGGYAKKSKTLDDFILEFSKKTKIPLEYVYTGKLFYAVNDLIRKKIFNDKKVTLIHTGGIFKFPALTKLAT